MIFLIILVWKITLSLGTIANALPNGLISERSFLRYPNTTQSLIFSVFPYEMECFST